MNFPAFLEDKREIFVLKVREKQTEVARVDKCIGA